MHDIIAEYEKIMDSQEFGEYDNSLLEKHVEDFTKICATTHSAVTIYNNALRRQEFMSEDYRNLFGTEDNNIHPDDYEAVIRGVVIALRYFFIGNKNIANHRLIRKYRTKIKGEYRVVVEQLQPLEFDTKGNAWLSIDFIDIAPNQTPPFKVESKIFNFKTGDIITPVDEYIDGKPILSERETGILKLINEGLLSKEIADKLYISVNTVNTHRQRILEKLKVGTSIEAIKYAAALGILDR